MRSREKRKNIQLESKNLTVVCAKDIRVCEDRIRFETASFLFFFHSLNIRENRETRNTEECGQEGQEKRKTQFLESKNLTVVRRMYELVMCVAGPYTLETAFFFSFSQMCIYVYNKNNRERERKRKKKKFFRC